VSQSVIEHLTVKDIAAQLNVSVGKVHQLISDGDLAAVNIGRGAKAYWRVSREDFNDYLTDQRAKTVAWAIKNKSA
jgi:excisionase family DNA binding protein